MQHFEPLYYGIDVDAVKGQMDEEDRRRAEACRAGARRRGRQRSPLLGELGTSHAVDGVIDRAALAPRGVSLS